MAVCNNYKYLYQYVNNTFMPADQVTDLINELDYKIGSISVSGSGSSSDLTEVNSAIKNLRTRVSALESSNSSGITGTDLTRTLASYYKKSEDIDVAFGSAVTFASGADTLYGYVSLNNAGRIIESTKGDGMEWQLGSGNPMVLSVVDGVTTLTVDKVVGAIELTDDTIIDWSIINWGGEYPWTTEINNLENQITSLGYVTEEEVKNIITNNFSDAINLKITEILSQRSLGNYVEYTDDTCTEIKIGEDEENVTISSSGISVIVDGISTPVLQGTEISESYIESLSYD